ncbi:MAG: hypothetical protein KGI50_06850 [Patescibacteria group bacterium]|nr:hypothetical protein [Patescibacteria group bacterium]MDE2439341.1 hypothetical protein [Patescibacteria group bacterium]
MKITEEQLVALGAEKQLEGIYDFYWEDHEPLTFHRSPTGIWEVYCGVKKYALLRDPEWRQVLDLLSALGIKPREEKLYLLLEDGEDYHLHGVFSNTPEGWDTVYKITNELPDFEVIKGNSIHSKRTIL